MTRVAFSVLALIVPSMALAGATASSFKKESRRGANFWNAQAAIDSDPATAWMVPGASANKGEWMLIELPKGEVDKIGIFPGWGKSEGTFKDYARVKTLKVEVLCCIDSTPMETLTTLEVTVQDAMEFQVIDVENVKLGNELFGGRIRLTVADTYSGQDYPNLAVSEVLVYLTEFDVDSASVERTTGDSDGHPGDHMRDGSTRSFWAGAHGTGEGETHAAFTVGAEGFGLSSIGIAAGPRSHSRPKRIKVTANNKSREYDMADKTAMQWFEVPALTGYTGSAWGSVEVEILEVYAGTSTDVAVAEVKVKATNYEGL